jgi:hypothetical protein
MTLCAISPFIFALGGVIEVDSQGAYGIKACKHFVRGQSPLAPGLGIEVSEMSIHFDLPAEFKSKER